MMGNKHSGSWTAVFNEIKTKHDAAYHSIDDAIKLEEDERPSDAVEKYKHGISLIDEALNIQVECPENPDLTWERATVMIQKMKKTRAEVLMRINSLQNQLEVHQEFEAPAPPPSYDEAMSNASNAVPKTYGELASALQAMKIEESNNPSTVIYSHDNVKLYFILPDGTVVSTTENLTLIIGIVEGIAAGQSSTTFLQIGDWIYPLVPGVSPCFHTEYGAFILPDLHSDVPGSSVGIILPSDADTEVFELLEDILHGVVSEKPPAVPPRRARRDLPGVSGSISRGLVTGAHYLSQGLIRGAERTGEWLNSSTPRLLENMQPAAAAAPVNPKVQKGIEVAKDVSHAAAGVTGYVANKVGCATMALGRFLAPHIQRQGTRLLSTHFSMSQEEAAEKVTGVLTVAAGAVEGFSTVYTGLESSAKILGESISSNTVKVVEHKYGHPSGELAGNTLNTVGNLYIASHNLKFFTPRGIAKSSVKATGRAMVEDMREELRPNGTVNTDTAGRTATNAASIEAPGTSGINTNQHSNDIEKIDKKYS